MRKAGKTAEKGKRICVPRVRAWPLFALLAAAPVLPLESPQQDFGDTVSVVNSFVRVLMPAGESPPWPSELELRWHGKSQRIVRIVGGPLATLELGIAVDESGSVYGLARDLRRVALGVMEGSVGEQDRTFLLGFGGRGEVLAEGRGEVDRVLAKLPTAPRAGATAFFDSLVAAIDHFDNTDPRAGLLAVSDGCDSSSLRPKGRLARDWAALRSIPIFLVRPSDAACELTACREVEAGGWECHAMTKGPSGPHWGRGLLEESADRPISIEAMSNERSRFVNLIRGDGGGDYIPGRDGDLGSILTSILAVLSRQWMIVFEPSSNAVDPARVSVTLVRDGRRIRLR